MHDAGAIVAATASERALVLECARLPEVVASATRNLASNEIADHTFAVAQAFSRFYTECPVLAADTEAETRLTPHSVRAHLAKELWLLGVDVPERM
jgi:arginyl-tRNA synthetase